MGPLSNQPKGSTIKHIGKGEKKRKRKVVDGLAIVEDHGLPCNTNWSLKFKFIPIHYDNTEVHLQGLKGLTPKRLKQ